MNTKRKEKTWKLIFISTLLIGYAIKDEVKDKSNYIESASSKGIVEHVQEIKKNFLKF